MKLLNIVFARLTDDEIKGLSLDILKELQEIYALDEKWQIQLLGRVIKKCGCFKKIYECTYDGINNGWSI